MKTCVTCGLEKPLARFRPKGGGRRANRCRPCEGTNDNARDRRIRRQRERDQPTACVVCGSDDRLVWDHDHATEEFRGWLCDACNKALGFARDSPSVLRALADYLER